MRANFILILLLLFSACTEKIDINLNVGDNNRLVVEGGITNELKIHTVKLTRSADYFSNEAPTPELNAQVSISDGTTVFELLDSNNDGIYETQSPVAGKIETEYTLNILLTDGSDYSAKAYMNDALKLDSLRYEYAYEFNYEKNDFDYVYKLFLFAQEPATTGDYYLWDLYIDNQIETDTLRKKVITDDKNVNGSYIYNFEIFRIGNERILENETNIKVSMQAISKAQYDFMLSVLFETVMKGSPFDGPPANIPTNLTNGALGFFYANPIIYTETTILKGQNATK